MRLVTKTKSDFVEGPAVRGCFILADPWTALTNLNDGAQLARAMGKRSCRAAQLEVATGLPPAILMRCEIYLTQIYLTTQVYDTS